MSELHAVQETRGSKCVSIWEKQSGGLFRSECSIAPPIRQPVSQCGRQIAAPTIMSWGPQKGFCLFGERRHYEMRAGWILLEIRHKQYEVNVDEVGADSIRPLNPAGRRRYAGAIEGIKTGRCGHRPLQNSIQKINKITGRGGNLPPAV